MSKVDIVLGAQLGDEGKGRLIDILASNIFDKKNPRNYSIVARCNSGGNAGHKVVINNNSYAFHMVPSGIINQFCTGIIGNGCVVNLEDLKKEITTIEETSCSPGKIYYRLFISNRAHIVLPIHKIVDGIREDIKLMEKGDKSIGTTRQGMGPVYSTKALRVGLRMCDLLLNDEQLLDKIKLLLDELKLIILYWNNLVESLQTQQSDDEQHQNKTSTLFNTYEIPSANDILEYLKLYIPYFKPIIKDTIYYLNNELEKTKYVNSKLQYTNILVEGAQSTLLDVDFGLYPY